MPESPNDVSDATLKDAFDIYQKQSDSVHKLWAYFQVVSIAVLGYTVGSDKVIWSFWTSFLISLSYGVFALSSHHVIAMSHKELNRFAKAVQEAALKSGPVGKQLSVESINVQWVQWFHRFSMLVVITAIWVTWYYKCFLVKGCS